MSQKLAVAFVCSMLSTVVACGGSDDGLSDFNKEDRDGTGSGNGPIAGNGPIGGDGSQTKPAGDMAACATQTATAEARPVYLVFQYDKSGSMGDNGKWSACKAATKAFFSSPESAGIKASLTFFPANNNTCSSGTYTNPAVSMAALPNAAFGAALDGRSPDGGTPTAAALGGAIDYAKTVAAGEGKDGKVAIVLVTDGVPANCGDNSISTVKNLAASVAATIPTYVIGVGNLGNLNEIAVGGGTKSAFIVSTGDPTKTQTELAKAINDIKQSAMTCDYKIPAAPAGETFDRAKVNVQHLATGSAAASTLTYNQSCAGGTGWRYDDATNPTRILLCDASCDTVKAKPGKVDILFGCATQSGPVK